MTTTVFGTELKNKLLAGIKKSSFNLTWKIATKFDLSKLEASLDKGLLHISIPVAEGKAVKQIKINTPAAIEDVKKKK